MNPEERPAKNEQATHEPRTFPLPGTTLYGLIFNPDFKETFHSRLKFSNRFIISLYKLGILPLFGIGKQIMLLRTRGRKSQRRRDFPVGYFYIDDTIHVFSGWGKAANWYKNLMAYPEDVYVQVGFHRFHARPEVAEGLPAQKQTLEHFVTQCPMGAQTLLGWDVRQDDLAMADFSVVIEKVLIVRFYE
jgi:deazaflavin-dependent oxidoreductase (nitroreductase family)